MQKGSRELGVEDGKDDSSSSTYSDLFITTYSCFHGLMTPTDSCSVELYFVPILNQKGSTITPRTHLPTHTEVGLFISFLENGSQV
jgi:hypothetical protein